MEYRQSSDWRDYGVLCCLKFWSSLILPLPLFLIPSHNPPSLNLSLFTSGCLFFSFSQSMYLSLCLYICVSLSLSTSLPACLPLYLSLSVYISPCLSDSLHLYLSVYISPCIFVSLSGYLSMNLFLFLDYSCVCTCAPF